STGGGSKRLPFSPAVLEVADELLLLRIDRDDWDPAGDAVLRLGVDVLELLIPIGMLLPFDGLLRGLKAVAEPVEERGDRRGADVVTQRAQLRGQCPHALRGPTKGRLGISARCRGDKLLERSEQRRVGAVCSRAAAACAPHPLFRRRLGWCSRERGQLSSA